MKEKSNRNPSDLKATPFCVSSTTFSVGEDAIFHLGKTGLEPETIPNKFGHWSSFWNVVLRFARRNMAHWIEFVFPKNRMTANETNAELKNQRKKKNKKKQRRGIKNIVVRVIFRCCCSNRPSPSWLWLCGPHQHWPWAGNAGRPSKNPATPKQKLFVSLIPVNWECVRESKWGSNGCI